MKKILLSAILGAFALTSMAQTDSTQVAKDSIEGFQFTTVDSIAITPVAMLPSASRRQCA